MENTIAVQPREPSTSVGTINVSVVNSNSRLKAFVNLTYAGMVLKGLRIFDGEKGLFVTPPAELGNDNKWHNHYYFAHKDVRARINDAVLAEYARMQDGGKPQPAAPPPEQPAIEMGDDVPF